MNVNKIALIGATNSGKTSFIEKMYHDINALSPVISLKELSQAVSLHSDVITPHLYCIELQQDNEGKKESVFFSLYDFKGTLISDKEMAGPGYYEFIKEINISEYWIILIDGECLNNDSFEANVKAIKKNCSRNIAPLITDYYEKKNRFPNILFVVTKNVNYPFSKEEVTRTVMEAFKMIIKDTYVPLIMLSDEQTSNSAGFAVLTTILQELHDSRNSEYKVTEIEKMIGAAVSILSKKQNVVNGFEKIEKIIDKDFMKTKKCEKFTTGAGIFDLGLLALLIIHIISVIGFKDAIIGILAMSVSIVLAVAIDNIVVRIIFGLAALGGVFELLEVIGGSGIGLIIAYVIWVIVSVSIASVIDDNKTKEMAQKGRVGYENEKVEYIYNKMMEVMICQKQEQDLQR